MLHDGNTGRPVHPLSRALEADEIQQLLNGWDEAFAVEPEGKLATTWARVKTAR